MFSFSWLKNWIWHSSNQLQLHTNLVFFVKWHYNLFTININFLVEWWNLEKCKLFCPIVKTCTFNQIMPFAIIFLISLRQSTNVSPLIFLCLPQTDFLPTELQSYLYWYLWCLHVASDPMTNSQLSYLIFL